MHLVILSLWIKFMNRKKIFFFTDFIQIKFSEYLKFNIYEDFNISWAKQSKWKQQIGFSLNEIRSLFWWVFAVSHSNYLEMCLMEKFLRNLIFFSLCIFSGHKVHRTTVWKLKPQKNAYSNERIEQSWNRCFYFFHVCIPHAVYCVVTVVVLKALTYL